MEFTNADKVERQEAPRNGAPTHRVSAQGITATVWSNPAPNGGQFLTITVDRSYKTKDGDWRTAKSFRLRDLPVVIMELEAVFRQFGMKEKQLETQRIQPGEAEKRPRAEESTSPTAAV